MEVSWYDAALFCNWLGRQEGFESYCAKEGKEEILDLDGRTCEYDAWKLIEGANGYRLPTEDEWEYACRARTTTGFAFGDDEELLDRYAVYVKNSTDGPSAVGGDLCNAWGLFNMHGNVQGLCQDWYEDRAYRGGIWSDSSTDCRTAYRDGWRPRARTYSLGFRVAIAPSGK